MSSRSIVRLVQCKIRWSSPSFVWASRGRGLTSLLVAGLVIGSPLAARAQDEQPPDMGGTPAQPAAAPAQSPPPEAAVEKEGEAQPLGHALLIYGKVGGVIPITPLGPHAAVRLGVGYVPPFLAGRLGLVADIGYQQMPTDKTLQDPRVGAKGTGSWNYKVTQHDLNLFVGPIFYILDRRGFWIPYVSAGVDVHFLRTDVEGEGAGKPFGSNQETATKVGFAARAGLGVHLGPGMVTGEVSFGWAPLDNAITGDSNLGRVNILVGYTLMLGFGGG